MDIEKYIDLTNQSMRDMETRIVEERRLSEERMEKRYDRTMAAIEKVNERMDERNKEFNESMNVQHKDYMAKLEENTAEIHSDMKELEKTVKSNNLWIMGVGISVILSVAAMVITVILK